MTDQRTLKRIIGEQRGIIEKQKVVIDELNENYLKLNAKLEKLEDAIKRRYAILAEQRICTDCFKDVPEFALLCENKTRKQP